MSKAIVWNPMGDILKMFDTVDEAEEWIEECDHQILARTHNDGDTNIIVMELP